MAEITFAEEMRALADAWEANMRLLALDPSAEKALEAVYDELPDYMLERDGLDSTYGMYTFDEWLAESEVDYTCDDHTAHLTIEIPSGETWEFKNGKWK